MKVKTSKTVLEDTEHTYPIFLYWENELDEPSYVKITEDSWIEIGFWFYGAEYKKEYHCTDIPIPEHRLNNICDEAKWLEGVELLKESLVF